MDEESCYWCAIHGAGVLHRYDPAGKLVMEVELPVSQPTRCAFFGPGLNALVVTSAVDKLTPGELRHQPMPVACSGCGQGFAASRVPASFDDLPLM